MTLPGKWLMFRQKCLRRQSMIMSYAASSRARIAAGADNGRAGDLLGADPVQRRHHDPLRGRNGPRLLKNK